MRILELIAVAWLGETHAKKVGWWFGGWEGGGAMHFKSAQLGSL